ncbi:unnamed protein product, partial [Brassica rapa]
LKSCFKLRRRRTLIHVDTGSFSLVFFTFPITEVLYIEALYIYMSRKVPKRNHKASSNEESRLKGIRVRGVDEHHQRRLLPPTVEKPRSLIAFKILGIT